ncbi:MAG: colanic acid biosynthesis glycosyltransferase WcaL, partial [Gluconacetobacter diazotrophicus]|nr:colanic acid biosynthesis glycosyltransferase WcaL [Gluconacetobacter diazotrophicus]
MPAPIVFLLKGYPRLSETFIAEEIAALERAGLPIHIVSLRHPTDTKRHPVHGIIRAPVTYLPEYLHHEPVRVLRALWHARRRPALPAVLKRVLADLRHDPSRNRVRRLGQALVLAAEVPARHLHAHFIHTPASVAAYAAHLTGLEWSCSAHAKDIWTTADRELRQKLAEARFTVTCTAAGQRLLDTLAP